MDETDLEAFDKFVEENWGNVSNKREEMVIAKRTRKAKPIEEQKTKEKFEVKEVQKLKCQHKLLCMD